MSPWRDSAASRVFDHPVRAPAGPAEDLLAMKASSQALATRQVHPATCAVASAIVTVRLRARSSPERKSTSTGLRLLLEDIFSVQDK